MKWADIKDHILLAAAVQFHFALPVPSSGWPAPVPQVSVVDEAVVERSEAWPEQSHADTSSELPSAALQVYRYNPVSLKWQSPSLLGSKARSPWLFKASAGKLFRLEEMSWPAQVTRHILLSVRHGYRSSKPRSSSGHGEDERVPDSVPGLGS